MIESPAAGRQELKGADDDFAAFCGRLNRREPLWWCFFSSGMLHVLAHFLRFVGDMPRIVLLSSSLTEQERVWMAERVDVPCFHIGAAVDPKSIYELLIRHASGPFGWIDVDCFLEAASWFEECEASLRDDVVLSGPFAYGPIPLLAAPFLLLNPAAIVSVEEKVGGPISLGSYAFHSTSVGRHAPGVTSRVLQPYHKTALNRVLCMEDMDLPFPQGGVLDVLDTGAIVRSHERFHHRTMGRTVSEVVFDAYVILQLLAFATGFRNRRIRTYVGSKVISPEVVHAGSIGYWERWIADVRPKAAPRGLVPWSGHIDTVLLDDYVRRDGALDQYATKLEQRKARLSANGFHLENLRSETAAMLQSAGVDVDRSLWAGPLASLSAR
jgi:dTDP-dihydrostreptose-streptidine-6-phosphate dihydrostreptosyltransferase